MFSASSKRIKIEAASASVVEGHEDFETDHSSVGKISSGTSNQTPVTYKLISPSSANGTGPSGAAATAVLTTPMSGQFYVIGNPSEVTTSGGSRVIAPKAAAAAALTLANNSTWTTVSDPSSGNSSGNNSSSSRRIDRRRATHNEVERRRRNAINDGILQLAKIIPGLDMEDQEKGPPKGGSMSKGVVLAKACDYVAELTEDNKILEKRVQDLEGVSEENDRLLSTIEELRQENAILKQQLETHGLSSSNMEDILS